MKNIEEHIDFEVLIDKYLNHNINEDEILMLENWVKEDFSHREQYLKAKHLWILTHTNSYPEFSSHAWKKVEQKTVGAVSFNTAGKKIKTKSRWWSIAAALVLIAVSSFAVQQLFFSSTEVQSHQSVLSINLSDQSLVELSDGAALAYNRKFNKKNREVELKGNAMFHVSKNPDLPFTIKTDLAEVTVLGTVFYIEQTDKKFNVYVEEGRVAVKINGQEERVLTKGRQINYKKTSKTLIQSEIQNENYLSWKTGILVFDETPIEAVAEDIGRQYNVEISIDKNVSRALKLTAKYEQKDLSSVLKLVSESLNVKISRKGNRIKVSQ
ncbi:MAG: FecR domain-containing protein [Bacteroidales bacterium]|nr:FecR domain-containing protein [Bacteroidales bacterium]